ncbi:MAG: hypothetical protein KatS3mg120_1248 [Erythrobacter sp.]|nr:MAG: hypothetical protein KatS3mg120_1248 [Erythrobacter sp.]
MLEDPLVLGTAGIVCGVIVAILAARYRTGASRRAAAPAPARVRGRIIVSGLSAAQTKTILGDFARLYDLDAQTFAALPTRDAMEVRWTRAITSDIALFLVNYLTYPGDRQVSGAPPQAVGVIAVPADIAHDGVTPGTLAKIFVPEGDTEHDLVHALTAGGRAFRISFTRMKWEPVATPKAPALADKVAFALEG